MHRTNRPLVSLGLRCSLLLLLTSSVTARAGSVAPFPGEDERWRRYESPRFEMFSHVSERRSRDLLRSLEVLHATITGTASLTERRALPVTIYYFDGAKEFLPYVEQALRSEDRTVGYYLMRPDRAVIVMAPGRDEEEGRRTIFHEYIHHVFALSGQTPALWYNEGMAEMFSTAEEDRGQLKLGLPIEGHVAELRGGDFLPLEALFATSHGTSIYNESQRAGIFYAEAWGLLHYLICGLGTTDPVQNQKLDRFLNYSQREGEAGDGLLRRALFEGAMGRSYADAERDLRRYFRQGRYQWFRRPLPDLPPAESYAMQPVDRAVMHRQLAALDLRANRSPLGRLSLLEAVTENPADYRSLEALGMAAAVEDNAEQASELWQAALAAGSRNPALYYELAAAENRRWFSQIDPTFRMPPARSTAFRELLLRSIESAPKQAQAYEILAWVEANAERPNGKNINLVQEHLGQVLDRNRTLLALALIRCRMGDVATAKLMVDQIEKSGPERSVAHACRALRASLLPPESAEP